MAPKLGQPPLDAHLLTPSIDLDDLSSAARATQKGDRRSGQTEGLCDGPESARRRPTSLGRLHDPDDERTVVNSTDRGHGSGWLHTYGETHVPIVRQPARRQVSGTDQQASTQSWLLSSHRTVRTSERRAQFGSGSSFTGECHDHDTQGDRIDRLGCHRQ